MPRKNTEEYEPTGIFGFRSRKAAQLAAYFAAKEGGKISKLKLTKLLYLSERESIARRARPMLYDEYYSFKDGPICSTALDGLNERHDLKTWSEYIEKVNSQTIKARPHDVETALDEMSKADRAIIEDVWDKFGHMSPSQIREWTHKNCKEYVATIDGRWRIHHRDIALAVGQNPAEVEANIDEYRSLEASINR